MAGLVLGGLLLSSAPVWAVAGFFANGGNSFLETAVLGTTDNFDLSVITNNTEKLRLETGGDFGIGTNNPSSKLHVVGTGNITGNTTIGGTLAVTGAATLSGGLTLTCTGCVTSANLASALTGKTYDGLTISTTTGTLSLANGSTLATSGANSITLTSTAATNLTLPTSGTLATLAGTETLTNKTLTAPIINSPTGITKSDVGLGNVDNTSDETKNSATATLTNKTFSLLSNVLTGTIAQFNSALSDADFTTLTGAEALTNKTYNGLSLASQSIGFTVAGGTTTKTLTLSDNASLNQSLLTSSTPTFSGLNISEITVGSLLFGGSSGSITQDNSNLFWDDTNNRLGLGTTSPGSKITAVGVIESTSGGFKFPDGTSQSSAATVKDPYNDGVDDINNKITAILDWNSFDGTFSSGSISERSTFGATLSAQWNVSNSFAELALNSGPGYSDLDDFYNKNPKFKARFKINQITHGQSIYVGFGNPINPLNVKGMGFKISTGTLSSSSSNGSGAETTTTITGITLTNYNIYEAKRVGSNAEFYINGNLVATHSTNIPTGGVTSGDKFIGARITNNETSSTQNKEIVFQGPITIQKDF